MCVPTTTQGARLIRLPDIAATERLAVAIARFAKRGDVIALEGDLGTGKTAFARAFIRAVGAGTGEDPGEVPSPTFTLVQTYAFAIATVWHFDLYRLSDAEEAIELGMEDAFTEGISLIEWPERLGERLPADRLTLRFEYGEGVEARVVTLVPQGSWAARLVELPALGGA